MKVETGLDRIGSGDPEALGVLRGRTLGLLAHPASIDARLRHAHRVLLDAGCEVRALFGPEHGYGGEAQDMIAVASEQREQREQRGDGVPVYSLYGSREKDLSPRFEQLEGLDAVVIDLQDVGSRYYTFVWTAALMLRACADCGVEVIVLDRPNPLGGERVEGAPQRPGYRSFVGLHDVSVRHGMTIGELCRLACARDRIDPATLSVIGMRGWSRAMSFADTGLPWVLPSPNMPTKETALVYPGGCLIEGTNLSEGRGTTQPFELWGAPELDGHALARAVAVEGGVLRPLHFTPSFHKHVGKRCGGVQVHVTDPSRFSPYAAYVRLLGAVRAQIGPAMAWRTEAYEYVTDRPAIDLLTGGPEVRTAIDQGAPLDDWARDDAAGAARFAAERTPYLLY